MVSCLDKKQKQAMTKKDTLIAWLNEPKAVYGSKSNICLGYGDGWDWVKDTLRPTTTKNAMFLRVLEIALSEIERFLKKKSDKKNLSEEDYTLYAIGYKDGVKDALAAIKGRFEKIN